MKRLENLDNVINTTKKDHTEWLENFFKKNCHKWKFYLKDLIAHWTQQRKESMNLSIGQSFQTEM